MASLERRIKCSRNLIWRGKREFLSFNLTSEAWVQRWIILQHNKVPQPFEKKVNKKSGSENMKQNLEKIFNLHFWLSMKTREAAGVVPEITATFCVWRIVGKHLPPRQETRILLPGQPPGRCYAPIMRCCRCVPGCWNLRATSEQRLVQQGLWAEDKLITLLVAPAISTQNGCHGCCVNTAGERSEFSPGEEKTLQLIWTLLMFF